MRTPTDTTTNVIDADTLQAWVERHDEVVRGEPRWAMDRHVRMAAGTLVTTGLLAGELVSPRLRLLAGAGAGGAGPAFSAATNTCAMGAALAPGEEEP